MVTLLKGHFLCPCISLFMSSLSRPGYKRHAKTVKFVESLSTKMPWYNCTGGLGVKHPLLTWALRMTWHQNMLVKCKHQAQIPQVKKNEFHLNLNDFGFVCTDNDISIVSSYKRNVAWCYLSCLCKLSAIWVSKKINICIYKKSVSWQFSETCSYGIYNQLQQQLTFTRVAAVCWTILMLVLWEHVMDRDSVTIWMSSFFFFFHTFSDKVIISLFVSFLKSPPEEEEEVCSEIVMCSSVLPVWHLSLLCNLL